MAVVSHKITIGSDTYQSPANTALKEVMIHNAIGIPTSSAEIVLAQMARVVCKAGDEVSVELGTDDKNKKVYTGIVKSIENALDTVRVSATSTMEALPRMYIDSVFDNKSCGAIFKDLAALVKVKVGKADDGLTFPRYVISSGRSLWKHIQQLSRYCATDVFTDPNDQFHFIKYMPSSGGTFTYGEDILEIEREDLEPVLDGIEVYGDSPAGQGQGDEASFWLKKQEVKGSAGKKSGVVARHAIYAARNKTLCDSIAANLFSATQSKAMGRALVLNGQGVALAQTVTFKNVPTKKINGTFKVTAVRHVLDVESGFTTEITWEEPA